MAKYTITHSCGHKEEIQLTGKYADRQYRIERMEGQDCAACRAAAANAGSVLPTLTGSDKQISWAADIRARFFAANPGMVAKVTATSAKWWIENRDSLDYIALQILAKEEKKAKAEKMTSAEIFRKAHRHARKVKAQYPDTDYRAQFALALKELYRQINEAKAA